MPVSLDKDTGTVGWEVYEPLPETRYAKIGSRVYNILAGYPVTESHEHQKYGKRELDRYRRELAERAYKLIAGREPNHPDIENQHRMREIAVSSIPDVPNEELRKMMELQADLERSQTVVVWANEEGSKMYARWFVPRGQSAAERVAAVYAEARE